jgi:hypothetical protein
MSKTIRRKNVKDNSFHWFDNEQEFNKAREDGRHEALQYRNWEHYQKKIYALDHSDNITKCGGHRANVPKDYRKPMETAWKRKQNQKLKTSVRKGDEENFSQDKHFKDAGYTYW